MYPVRNWLTAGESAHGRRPHSKIDSVSDTAQHLRRDNEKIIVEKSLVVISLMVSELSQPI
jgi:hypothetical protein